MKLNLNIRYEILNFLTGVVLLVVGAFDLFRREYTSAANWLIFGSMYLIMDDYMPKVNLKTSTEKFLDLGRKVFSWFGLIAAVVFFVYTIS